MAVKEYQELVDHCCSFCCKAVDFEAVTRPAPPWGVVIDPALRASWKPERY
ncbi:uncharacterized protein P884DRAFT_303124 [Thermothelomyces heterothallicus CBS 202.75]|uniref:uncharacterized protein n=1 Tax=Thermothelomyces heterothallicus CBS 202.75 TaxID=1149848 RepID=UPI0037425AA9